MEATVSTQSRRSEEDCSWKANKGCSLTNAKIIWQSPLQHLVDKQYKTSSDYNRTRRKGAVQKLRLEMFVFLGNVPKALRGGGVELRGLRLFKIKNVAVSLFTTLVIPFSYILCDFAHNVKLDVVHWQKNVKKSPKYVFLSWPHFWLPKSAKYANFYY